ncbi:hypothetical protein HYS31_03325, partial [Candidatus Woesearchaeota archaeon]|nr:hypothetical protein [Candidatus Woesearchaeota archaeon]
MKFTEIKIKDKVYLALVGLFIALIFASPSYNHVILNKGIYFHHPESFNQLKDLEKNEKIIFFKESQYSSISVTEQKEFFGTEADKPTYFDTLRTLRINGKIQCGTGKFDITTTTLLAALPLLIHKEPKNALNIG